MLQTQMSDETSGLLTNVIVLLFSIFWAWCSFWRSNKGTCHDLGLMVDPNAEERQRQLLGEECLVKELWKENYKKPTGNQSQTKAGILTKKSAG